MSLPEHSIVRMTQSLEVHDVVGGHRIHLVSGQRGTIVHVHPNAAAYVVEFLNPKHNTIAVVELLPNQIEAAENQCMGCQANWPFLGDTKQVHKVIGGYPGELVGCTAQRYSA